MTMDFIGCDNYNLFVLMRKKNENKNGKKEANKIIEKYTKR